MGYADDNMGLRLFPACASLSVLHECIPSCLSKIKEWADSHFLNKMNSNKTEVIVFHGSSPSQNFVDFSSFITNTGSMSAISNHSKLLGFQIDDTLKMNHQVTCLSRSVNVVLRNLCSVRHMTPESSRRTLVHSLVMSKIDNCNSLYLGTSEENMHKLQMLQNAALRYLRKLSPAASISTHFREEHWLNIRQRISFKYLTIIFKCINNAAPTPLQNKLFVSCPERMLLDTSRFHPRTMYGRKSFSYLAPRMWNALPLEGRLITEFDVFKRELKTYLFDNMDRFLRNVNPYSV